MTSLGDDPPPEEEEVGHAVEGAGDQAGGHVAADAAAAVATVGGVVPGTGEFAGAHGALALGLLRQPC